MSNLTLAEQDALDFETLYPQPQAPEVFVPSRPKVFALGDAHVWMDVVKGSSGYGKPDRATARLYVIERHEGRDLRIQIDLDYDTLSALIGELNYACGQLNYLQNSFASASQYETALREWQASRDQYVRGKRLEREEAMATAKKAGK